MRDTFQLTDLGGKPHEGLFRAAVRGNKKFTAARIKSAGPVRCHRPSKYQKEGLSEQFEVPNGIVIVLSLDRKDWVAEFSSIEEFTAAGYKFA